MPSDLIRGWIPVRVKKTRQIKNLEPRFDSIETENALDRQRPAAPAQSDILQLGENADHDRLHRNRGFAEQIGRHRVAEQQGDITLSELALETFFPADELTAERMRAMAAGLQ
jgi:hypothetical protein